jgi:predicted GNAT family N-acyltransferase
MKTIESYVSNKLEQRKSRIQGVGLFAIEPITKDEIVFVKGGHVLTRETMFSRGHIDAYWPISDDLVLAPIDEDEVEGVKVFINHSCDPNCGIRGDIVGVAIRDIKIGEEITFDYAVLDNENHAFLCGCGSDCCRKVITGFDWMIRDLQISYAGYFTEYLKEKLHQGTYYISKCDITDEIHKFRRKIFIDEQKVAYPDEFEGSEDRYIHCCLYMNNELAAYARVTGEDDYAKISRVSVRMDCRGSGIGNKIMQRAEIEAYKTGYKKSIIHAQLQALGFYKKLGYIVNGEEFVEAGISHIEMKKVLIY